MQRSIGILVASLALAQAANAGAIGFYLVDSVQATDIGTLGGDEAAAYDINNEGVIVGWSRASTSTKRAFRYKTSMTGIGPNNAFIPSEARGINDLGEVVGWYTGNGKINPFYWNNGSYIDMSSELFADQGFGDLFIVRPFAINNHGNISGQAKGTVFAGEGAPPPYLPWTGCYVDFPIFWRSAVHKPERMFCAFNVYPGNIAYDVNDTGEIAGTEQASRYKGFIWQNGIRTNVPQPTQTGYARDIHIFGINAAGRVVGYVDEHVRRAIYWNQTTALSQSLGVLPGGEDSEAYEINDASFVAGYSTTLITGYLRSRGFLWHPDFGMYQLPLPPNFSTLSTDCVARSVNNRVSSTGRVQVVGYCTKGGKSRAVRWDVTVNFLEIAQQGL